MNMKKMVSAVCALGASVAMAATNSADVVVFGASSAGIAAAVQATRMNLNVVVLEPYEHVGGLTTGGLGATDTGRAGVTRAIGGISREFYQAVKKHYEKPQSWTCEKAEDYEKIHNMKDSDAMWFFEPSVAQGILDGWIKRDKLRIIKNAKLDRGPDGVTMKDGKIAALRTLGGDVWQAKVFIDATYEGDLMAAAGVKYTVGREANSVYGETLNGAQPNEGHHKLRKGVDPYVVKGNPASGLLPGIDPEPMGEVGEGDKRVQAYCYRMCLTDEPSNRIAFEKPAGYDERDYELLFRNFEAGEDHLPLGSGRMPNRKTDTNNARGTSSDFIGQNYTWAEASYTARERMAAAHLKYQKGLVWTLANHPRVPQKIRREFVNWGVCKDEFVATHGWSPQLYVREARRMIGEFIQTEQVCRGEVKVAKPIALATYMMDSHHVRRYVTAEGYVQNEGDVEVGWDEIEPYPIDYGAITPKRAECRNLLVPICLSASHIAYGSIRMEPVFFAVGQAAGTAAALAIKDNVDVQGVDYNALRARLLADGQVITWEKK